MTDLIPFNQEHLKSIKPRDIYPKDDEFKKRFLNRALHSESFSLVSGSEVIAIFVISKLWSGVYDVVGLTSDLVKKYKVSVHKAALSLLNSYGDEGAVRAQVLVKNEFEEGCQWVKRLGFKSEGV